MLIEFAKTFMRGRNGHLLSNQRKVELASAARWYVYFQTKKPNLGKFWKVLQWKM
jgi:hypothetical protein